MVPKKDIIEFLSKFTERLGHLNTEELVGEVLQFITLEMKLKRASVAVLEPDNSGFILRDVTYDIKDLVHGSFLPFSSTPISQSVQSQKPIYRPDIKNYKPSFQVDDRLLAEGLKSDFIVPLIIEGQCLGTLNSGSDTIDGISQHNRTLLTIIAPKLTLAMRNAKLYEEVHEKERRYQSLLQSMDDMVFVLDTENRFTSFYAPEEQLFKKPEAFLGKKHSEVMPSDVNKKFNQALANIKQGKKGEYQYPLESPDELQWFSVTLSPLKQEGDYSGLVAVSRDITERKRVEESLKQSEHRYRLLADHTYDWEYWIDPDGNYIYISPACERISGYSAEELFVNPRLVYEMVDPDYAERIKAHFDDENNRATPVFVMQFSIISKSGEKRWLEHHCSPVFDKQGNYVGRRGNNRDITERKKDEEDLRLYREQLEERVKERTAELEIKNQELERFNKLFIGREFRIKELRDQVKELEKRVQDK